MKKKSSESLRKSISNKLKCSLINFYSINIKESESKTNTDSIKLYQKADSKESGDLSNASSSDIEQNSTEKTEQKSIDKSAQNTQNIKMIFSNTSQLHKKILRRKANESRIKEDESSKNSSQHGSFVDSGYSTHNIVMAKNFVEKGKDRVFDAIYTLLYM